MRAIMMRTKNVVHTFTKKYNYIKKLVNPLTTIRTGSTDFSEIS